MRKIIVFTILFLTYSFTSIPSNLVIENEDDFSIEIAESAMFINNKFEISQDCINIRLQTPPIKDISYSKVVSKADRKVITDLLDKIEFDSLRKSYSNNAADCMLEYTFKIKYKNIDREIDIYDMKVKPIFDVVAKINTFLPSEFRINYIDRCFSRK